VLGRTDPRVEQALAEWAKVAPSLGLDPKVFRAKLIWQKDEPKRSHIVVRLSGPKNLILKQVFSAPSGEDLVAGVVALHEAHERLLPYDHAHAPEVVFANDTGNFVVMTEAKGKTLNDHLEKGRSHVPMLRRTGAWLAAFHASGATEQRTYQPKFMVQHAARLADDLKSGAILVPEPDLYLQCCHLIKRRAIEVQGRQTISANKHGDFNLRNILLGPDGETGLDFKPPTTAPVGFDIARILMDYAELFQSNSEVAPGEVLATDTIDAFFSGYDLVDKNDPAVRFVPFVQLLNDWRLIPFDPTRRSWRQKIRLDRVVFLARNACK